jgi:hypothetical protein
VEALLETDLILPDVAAVTAIRGEYQYRSSHGEAVAVD